MTNYNPFEKEISKLDKTDLDLLITNQVAEGWFIEYKSGFPSNKKISHSISSFANSDGGWFIIGIKSSEKTNIPEKIEGFDINSTRAPKDKIRNIITNHIHPTPFFESKLISIDRDNAVLVIHVERGDETPYVTLDGRIYQRVGEGSDPIPLNDHYLIQKLYERSKEINFHIEEFSQNKFVHSNEQTSKQGMIEAYFFIPPSHNFSFDKFISDDFFNDATNNFNSPVKLVEGTVSIFNLNFNNCYSSISSIILRSFIEPEEFIHLGLTLELFANGNLKMLIPVQEFTFADFETIPNNYIESQYIGDFINSIPENIPTEIRLIDGYKCALVLMILYNQYCRFLRKNGFDGNLKARLRVSNIDRTIIYLDDENYIKFIEENGLPVCLKENVEVPPFYNGNSIILDIENSQSVKLFAFLCQAFGIHYSYMEKITKGLGEYLSQLITDEINKSRSETENSTS